MNSNKFETNLNGPWKFAQNMMQRHCCTGTRMWYHSWCHVVVLRISFVVVAHLRPWCLPEQDPLHIGKCMTGIGMQTYACHIISYPIISCHAHVPSIFMHFHEYLLISWVKGEAVLCNWNIHQAELTAGKPLLPLESCARTDQPSSGKLLAWIWIFSACEKNQPSYHITPLKTNMTFWKNHPFFQ